MIKRDELLRIGQFNKPHGIKGELSFSFTDDSFDESECPFLICELEGIFVPFYMEEYRFKSDSTVFVKLKGVDSDQQAKAFSNLDVYFPKKYIDKDSSGEPDTWNYFIGYTIHDEHSGPVGTILDVDVTTINTLFLVDFNGTEILIPAIEEIIQKIDEERKIIFVELPEGILNLNN